MLQMRRHRRDHRRANGLILYTLGFSRFTWSLRFCGLRNLYVPSNYLGPLRASSDPHPIRRFKSTHLEIPEGFALALTCTMGSRLMLNLRATYYRSPSGGTRDCETATDGPSSVPRSGHTGDSSTWRSLRFRGPKQEFSTSVTVTESVYAAWGSQFENGTEVESGGSTNVEAGSEWVMELVPISRDRGIREPLDPEPQ